MPTSVLILERLKCVACYARALSLPLKVYAMEQVKETMTFVYRLKEHPRRESGTTYKVLPKADPDTERPCQLGRITLSHCETWIPQEQGSALWNQGLSRCSPVPGM